ncbi:uncharacterized protein KD926_010471 [Aspergillus affinis]|uniref:uncharacterized protein n=1 Tax=Aspergillus affinis TaxID=1070780 RepID=UPI0022FE81F1|nr:uncharacterized protein KD926_010471 [Aspergillus affinis]KAI9038736.1 hypothetical protein KD926_010471 [Aspergillus affinis]
MSTLQEKNKAVVQKYFEEYWGKGNVAVVDEVCAHNFIIDYPMHGPRRGKEAAKKMLLEFREHTGREFDDLAVGKLDRPSTGREVYFSGTTIFTMKNGKIVDEIGEEQALTALQQLGLVAPPNPGKEINVAWAEDQDPFGHVMWQAYGHITGQCFNRIVESFHKHLGDKFQEFMAASGINAMSRRITMDVRRVVEYPDLLITGARISEVRPDQFFWRFSVWSTKQRVAVAEAEGWMVFFNHRTGKKVDLPREGGVYADLHAALVRRAEESTQVRRKWEENWKVASRRANL